MAEAKVSVRSDLLKIADDLKTIKKQADETAESLAGATKEVGKQVDDQTAFVRGGLDKLRKFSKGVADQMKDDFKALFSVNAMTSGLKLNDQFASSIKQAVTLSDTIRNLGPIFGMNQDRAERFKRSLVGNLSEIGVGADAAASALQGLAQTNVRGDENLTAYSRNAGELASISKQKGQEGQIAKGLAGAVVAKGENPNDPKAMQKVSDDVLRIRNATGKSATEALDMLNKLFSSANSDFKKRLSAGGGVSLAAAGLLGGEGSTGFLQRYMGMDDKRRSGLEAQGMGRLVGKDGSLNQGAFQSTVSEAKRRGQGNAEFGLTTMGMSEEEAKGFLRLSEAMKQNGAAIESARTQVVDINKEYRDTMGMGDAFNASINRVKGMLSRGMAEHGMPDVLGRGTGMLAGAGQSDAGSAAVVGGGALLAAMLTSKGLKGIGGALFGGEAKKAGIEAVTGEKVQRVEVINWPTSMEGAWSSWGGAAKGAGGIAAGAGAGGAGIAGAGLGASAALAGGVGLVAGDVAKYIGEGGAESDAGDALKAIKEFFMGKEQNVRAFPTPAGSQDVKVVVESRDRGLKATPRGSRGGGQ